MDKINLHEKPLDPIISDWAFELANFEAYEYLEGDVEIRKQIEDDFIGGKIVNPQLNYPKLKIDDLIQKEEQLLAFKQLLKKEILLYSDENTNIDEERLRVNEMAVRQAYLLKVNEKLAEVRMLMLTYEYTLANAENDTESVKTLMRKFQKYSEFIYGKPSPEIFQYTLNQISNLVNNLKDSPNPQIQDALKNLLNLIQLPVEPSPIQVPDSETFSAAKKATFDQIGDLVELVSVAEDDDAKEDTFTAEEIQQIFIDDLAKIGGEDWQVIVEDNPSRIGVYVSQENKKIVIPNTRKLSFKKLQPLIAHELGTHVARRVNGERSKLRLLGIGLDRYKDDEGIARMREQVFGNKLSEYAGFDGHLAIGLATGVDGIKRDFRQVYEIMAAYNILKDLRKYKETTNDSTYNYGEIVQKAKHNTYIRCLRTFRGTSCDIPGVSYNKDIFYREHNVEVWAIMSRNPSASYKFNLGKYDPANSNHILLLTTLGILDEDLEELDK